MKVSFTLKKLLPVQRDSDFRTGEILCGIYLAVSFRALTEGISLLSVLTQKSRVLLDCS